jgi:hypothetical protein
MNHPLPAHRLAAGFLLVVLMAFFTEKVSAHVGPPFPILSDQKIPGYEVAIWADPDIGEALFYVVLEPSGTTSVEAVSRVEFRVAPVSSRLPTKSYPTNQQKARGHLRYVATPEFDIQEVWNVSVEIHLKDGTIHPLSAQVESTPPGMGRWDLLVYFFPFVLFGSLWAMTFVRRSRRNGAREQPAHPSTNIADRRRAVYQETAP